MQFMSTVEWGYKLRERVKVLQREICQWEPDDPGTICCGGERLLSPSATDIRENSWFMNWSRWYPKLSFLHREQWSCGKIGPTSSPFVPHMVLWLSWWLPWWLWSGIVCEFLLKLCRIGSHSSCTDMAVLSFFLSNYDPILYDGESS